MQVTPISCTIDREKDEEIKLSFATSGGQVTFVLTEEQAMQLSEDLETVLTAKGEGFSINE